MGEQVLIRLDFQLVGLICNSFICEGGSYYVSSFLVSVDVFVVLFLGYKKELLEE